MDSTKKESLVDAVVDAENLDDILLVETKFAAVTRNQ